MALSKKNKLTGFFVTGTDTGVGKTHIATQLIKQLAEQGLRVTGFKPVASGATRDADGWTQEDVEALRAVSSVKLPHKVMNPYCFEPPIAPVIAAKQVGVSMTIDALVDVIENDIAPIVDAIVVEGAGGWLLQLSESETLVDLAIRLQLPVVLVVGVRLGCINHALLTYQSICESGVPIKGWYANHIEPGVLCARAQVDLLKESMSIPLLGEVDYDSSLNKSTSVDLV